jgi:hypothetical protein
LFVSSEPIHGVVELDDEISVRLIEFRANFPFVIACIFFVRVVLL